jgi:vacuolar-type H+-ATPase subunit H
MHIYTPGSAMENEPNQNLADNFEQRPNEPATRNDLRTLATLVDRRFNKVDLQFQTMQTMFKEEMFEFRESMRKEMFEFREAMRKEMSDFRESMHRDMTDFRESMRKEMFEFRESMRKDTSDFKDMMRKEAGDSKESMRKETSDSKESMRKDMYKFAGFLTVTVISAMGVFGAFVR